MQDARAGAWPQHLSILPWLASEPMRMHEDSGSSSDKTKEEEGSGEPLPESREVPDKEPDAEVYEINVDGTVEISGAVTITIRKVQ